MMAQLDADTAFQAADDAWHAELVATFGKHANHFRYSMDGRGEAGSTLRALFDVRAAAHDAWLTSRNCGRVA